MLFVGLAVLVKAADYLIDGASGLARRYGVPPLVIGLSVVALGTSMPEFFVNVISALQGSTQVAMGNVVGSNIANLFLILGVAALIRPPRLAHSTVWKEIPFSLVAIIALLVLTNVALLDGTATTHLSRSGGIILLLFMAVFVYYLIGLARDAPADQADESGVIAMKPLKLYVFIFGGIVGLYFGGKWTVDGATSIAASLGMSEYLISATIIALGTSLPELVTSVKAALKGNSDMAVGNIVGSNIVNIFLILGVTSVVAPVELPNGINVDMLVLAAGTVVLFLSMFVGKVSHFGRLSGGVFVGSYFVYVGYLISRG